MDSTETDPLDTFTSLGAFAARLVDTLKSAGGRQTPGQVSREETPKKGYARTQQTAVTESPRSSAQSEKSNDESCHGIPPAYRRGFMPNGQFAGRLSDYVVGRLARDVVSNGWTEMTRQEYRRTPAHGAGAGHATVAVLAERTVQLAHDFQRADVVDTGIVHRASPVMVVLAYDAAGTSGRTSSGSCPRLKMKW